MMVIMMAVRQSVASNAPQTQHSNSSQGMRKIQFPSHASITVSVELLREKAVYQSG